MKEFLIVSEWIFSPWLKKIFEFECSERLQNEGISNCFWVNNFTNVFEGQRKKYLENIRFIMNIRKLRTMMKYRYRDYHSYPKFQTGFISRVESFGRKNCNRNIEYHAKFSSQPGFIFFGQRNLPNFLSKVGPKRKVVYETYPTIFGIIFQSDGFLWVLRSKWVRGRINKSRICFS